MTQLPVNPEPEGDQLCVHSAAFYGKGRQPVEKKKGGAQYNEDSPIPAVPGYPLLVFLQGAVEPPVSLLSIHAGPASTFGPLLSGSPNEGPSPGCLASLFAPSVSSSLKWTRESCP